VKFSNVSSLTLFFPESRGAETIRIYYLGFFGHWTEACSTSLIAWSELTIFFQRKNNPVITVYETQANIADHPKIQGTEGNFSTTQK